MIRFQKVRNELYFNMLYVHDCLDKPEDLTKANLFNQKSTILVKSE